MVMLITKEEAKKRIDESPGEMIILNTYNSVMDIHNTPVRIDKDKGKAIINKSDSDVYYENNDVFGVLTMSVSPIDHHISFVQRQVFDS